jgi:hypothetical protein
MPVHHGGETSWSRRYKANLERLGSGDRAKIAEVVRGLSGLDRDHGLSAGEQRMLLRARQLLKEPPGDGEETGVREPRRPPAPSGVGAPWLCRWSQRALQHLEMPAMTDRSPDLADGPAADLGKGLKSSPRSGR